MPSPHIESNIVYRDPVAMHCGKVPIENNCSSVIEKKFRAGDAQGSMIKKPRKSSYARNFEGSSKEEKDDTVPVAVLTTLINRIDQLERRLEDRDSQHADDINTLRADHQRQLDEQAKQIIGLQTTVQKQQQEIKNLQEAVAVSDTVGSKTDQKALVGVQVDHISPKAVSKSKQRIRRGGNEVQVAFFSTLSATSSHLGPNQNIIFDRVVTNIGNAYHAHLGSFIAPVDGTYVFSVTLMTDLHHTAHYALFKNATLIGKLSVHGAENAYDTTTQSAILYLAQGGDVSVRHLDTDHGLFGDNYCAFSGFLLDQDYTGGSPIVGK